MKVFVDGKILEVYVTTLDSQRGQWDCGIIDIQETLDDDIAACYDDDIDSPSCGCYVLTKERYEEFKSWWIRETEAYNRQEPSFLYGENEDPHSDYCLETYEQYPEHEFHESPVLW